MRAIESINQNYNKTYVISLEYLPYEISRIVNCFSTEHTVMLRSSDNTVSYTHFKIPT